MQTAESFISRPNALNTFSLIIVSSPISPDILSQLSAHATQTSVPLFYIHSVGFYAHFSIHLPHTFPIVDTHPDPVSTTDLRLVKPWAELSAFAAEKTNGLDTMDHHDHGHVPYVLLLLHHLEEWKRSHDGKVPSVYKEKNEFRDLVRAAMRTKNAEGGEENYEEAIAAVLKSLNEPTPSSGVKEVFSAEECGDRFDKDVWNYPPHFMSNC
jgi:amyloid beta precursor protein binding protein 1